MKYSKQIRVAFVARLDRPILNASVHEQAYRIAKYLPLVDPGIDTKLHLVEEAHCSRFSTTGWNSMFSWANIIVVVKPTLIPRFLRNAQEFLARCREKDVLVVCAPVDERWDMLDDDFLVNKADFAFTVSKYQWMAVDSKRIPNTTFDHGHAVRTNFEFRAPFREEVRRVVWENPVHYYPHFPDNLRAPYIRLEDRISRFCNDVGIEFLPFLSYQMDYQGWVKVCISADIAMECKALFFSHSEQQKRKPATKAVNFLSLGIPVICDSVPSYVDAANRCSSILLANTPDQYIAQLARLVASSELRKELAENAVDSMRDLSIENHCRRYSSSLRSILSGNTAVRSASPC